MPSAWLSLGVTCPWHTPVSPLQLVAHPPSASLRSPAAICRRSSVSASTDDQPQKSTATIHSMAPSPVRRDSDVDNERIINLLTRIFYKSIQVFLEYETLYLVLLRCSRSSIGRSSQSIRLHLFHSLDTKQVQGKLKLTIIWALGRFSETVFALLRSSIWLLALGRPHDAAH